MSTGSGTPGANANEIFGLIRHHTSQAVVKDYLKTRGVPFSAPSWDALKLRVDAALEAKKITKADLYRLLCDVEEHGRQHVFLFERSAKSAVEMLDPSALATRLDEVGWSSLGDKPKVLARPPRIPTLVDARQEDDGSLVLKFVERRRKYTLADEGEERGLAGLGSMQWVKRWDIEEVRAVNVLKFRIDGLAEVRIYSGADDYESAVQNLQKATSQLISWDRFSETSLSKVKSALWEKRDELQDLVSFSNSSLHHDQSGVSMTAATGRAEDDLSHSSPATNAVEKFIDGGGYVNSSSVYFKPRGDPPRPARPLHVSIDGGVNEFAIPVQCGMIDYEYVLEQLRRHNR